MGHFFFTQPYLTHQHTDQTRPIVPAHGPTQLISTITAKQIKTLMVFNPGVAQYVIAYSFKHFNSLNLMVPPSTDNAVHFSEAKISIFLPRDAMLARYRPIPYMPWPMSPCQCPRLRVCLSQVGVLLKRLNIRSHKQHKIAQ